MAHYHDIEDCGGCGYSPHSCVCHIDIGGVCGICHGKKVIPASGILGATKPCHRCGLKK